MRGKEKRELKNDVNHLNPTPISSGSLEEILEFEAISIFFESVIGGIFRFVILVIKLQIPTPILFKCLR
jgi:hypothetical protein